MNRRNFIRNFVIGLIAGPAIVKVSLDEEALLPKGLSYFTISNRMPKENVGPWFDTSSSKWRIFDEQKQYYVEL